MPGLTRLMEKTRVMRLSTRTLHVPLITKQSRISAEGENEMKAHGIMIVLAIFTLAILANQPIYAADKLIDLEKIKSDSENYGRTDSKSDSKKDKGSKGKQETLKLIDKDKPKAKEIDDLTDEDHKQITGQIMEALKDPKISALMKKTLQDYSAKLPIAQAAQLTVQDPEVQFAVLNIVKPKLSQAPFYFPDERIMAFVMVTTEDIGKELKESIKADLIKQGLNPDNAYMKSARLAFEDMSESQKIELLTIFTKQVGEDEKLLDLIAVKALDLEKTLKLSCKQATMGAILDAVVQKKITDKMTPILSIAPYSWTEDEIDAFIKAASMNLANELSK